MKKFIFLGLSLLAVVFTATMFAAAPSRTGTPEAVVDRFIEGYRRGDESMVLSTLKEAGGLGPVASPRDETFQIIEKLQVLSTFDVTSKVGDIHLRVRRQIMFPTGQQDMMAYFRLRRIGAEWKIVGYAGNY